MREVLRNLQKWEYYYSLERIIQKKSQEKKMQKHLNFGQSGSAMQLWRFHPFYTYTTDSKLQWKCAGRKKEKRGEIFKF